MAVSEQSAAVGVRAIPARREIVYRHSVIVRVTHWINVLCLTLLLMSGLKLFNVHPALYYDLWAQCIVRNVHMRVMRHIKSLAEAPVSPRGLRYRHIDGNGIM